MKILMVCPDWFPNSAGLAQSCYDLCKQFETHGHSVKIIVAKDKRVDKKGMDIKEVPFISRLGGRNPLPWRLWKNIKDDVESCDVVCLFSYMYIMNSFIASYRGKGLIKKPVIHFYRGSLESEFLNHVSFFTKISKQMYDLLLAKPLFRDVDMVISNSGPTLKIMEEKFGADSNKLNYIKNALNVKEYPKWKREHKRVIFIGRLVDNKGVCFFERILQSIPKKWKFTVVGDGPLRDEIIKLKKKYFNLDFVGKVNHRECLNLLSRSDINVLPTFAEGSPRSVMEASACGVPSISFAVGDVVNTIPKNCGFAIKPYDIEEFCKSLELLISDSVFRQEMGRNSLKFAEENLEWSIVYPKIEKLVQGLISNFKK